MESAPTYINTPGQPLVKTNEGFFSKDQGLFIEIIEIDSAAKLKGVQKLGR